MGRGNRRTFREKWKKTVGHLCTVKETGSLWTVSIGNVLTYIPAVAH